ncbi:hypothetical protein EYZ11_005198 [Aspergillus tanneri]|uniref:Uncharacterized protein n=1 Tax=Aspergillus tanneri TaxID=1220188 RepID=A0A4S3JL06_9EURO|nr:uncharacterized protein ATNIH1004_000099 [Aspergillus tanneri]KAA8651221.1 hypothetical protein ATNIH1004_000099 [Aspergillus tanneri]THC95338.1 hypothetical protein EYZ11_005198 [Aspergillus tanneri]
MAAFISGPLDTGPNDCYFHTYYVPQINEAITRDDDFVIGPILSGVDANALAYLLSYPVSPTRITVFATAGENSMWGSGERDAAMTAASVYDILRVRTRDESRRLYGRMWREGHITNTERNWKRRRGIAEDVEVSAEEIHRSMGFTEKKGLFNRLMSRCKD